MAMEPMNRQSSPNAKPSLEVLGSECDFFKITS